MTKESFLSHSFVFSAGTSVVGIGVDADATAWGEETRYLDVFWIHETYEVLHDDVDTILVEVTMVAEGEEVELEALALHHATIRKV